MTAAALLLVLGAAVLHAGWNALTKRAGDPVVFLWWVGVLASALYAPIALAILIRDGFTAAAIPFVLGTIVLHALYFFTLGRAYATGDFSLVYPIARGLGVALVPMAALTLWDERLSPLGTGGVILVASGIFLTLYFIPSTGDVVYHGTYLPLRGQHFSEAYASTVDLSFNVRGGLLMRQMHHWSANIFVGSIVGYFGYVWWSQRKVKQEAEVKPPR